MQINKTPPDLYIYTPDKRTMYGMVVQPQELSVDYNFNVASKMSFKVNKFIYDTDNYSWIKNPCYDALSQNMLIASTDNTPKCQFKGKTEVSYGIGTQVERDPNATGLGYSTVLTNAVLQDETELFDIGSSAGYAWQYYCYINDDGSFVDCSGNDTYYNRIACKEFFPVKVGDIISMGSKVDSTTKLFGVSGNTHYSYRVHYYSSAAAINHVSASSFALYSPVGRVRVKEGVFGTDVTTGYIRIEAISHQATLTSNKWYSTSPKANYVKIYSGERRCSSVNGSNTQTTVQLPERWWVIEDIEECNDFINSTKTITLYSYEYILSKKSFSIGQATLPLYIPESISDLVNSDSFVIDSVNSTNYTGKQRMYRGLINQLLDYIPDWSVGYITPDIITRYRSIDDVDNGNVYSFLMNTVQSLYKCYILFNTEDKTINLISQDDVIGIKSNTILTWSNAIKSLTVTNSDTKYATAMRVHTSEDEYGIGLVNPTGNNMIYNFNNVKENLDFVADDTHYKDADETEVYTLKEVVELYEQSIKDVISGVNTWGYADSYRTNARELIETTQKYTELETKLSQLLTEYVSIADTINIYLQDDYEPNAVPTDIIITDTPRTPAQMKDEKHYAPQSGYSNYHSKSLYNKLYSAAEAYWECQYNIDTLTIQKNATQNALKYIALMHSLNYKTLKVEYDKCSSNGTPYYPIFTPKEALALSYYIYEADWTDDNAVFSEQYSVSDIMNTLIDVYNNAKQELDDIYSTPTYEFDLEVANVFAIPEMQPAIDNLYLGNSLSIINKDCWVYPVLLSVHIEYENLDNCSMQLSTDYKRKPLEMRFSDLFGTIEQVSVEVPAFTFDK